MTKNLRSSESKAFDKSMKKAKNMKRKLIAITIFVIICIGIYRHLWKVDEHPDQNSTVYSLSGNEQYLNIKIHKKTRLLILEDPKDHWERELSLDPRKMVILKWNLTEEHITMMVIAKTNGSVYLGFSYSENLEMDVISGDAHLILDYHRNGRNEMILDNSQDYQFLKGKSNKTHTSFLYRRKIDTCDKYDTKFSIHTITIFWGLSECAVNEFTKSQLDNFNFEGKIKTAILYKAIPKPEGKYINHYDLTVRNIRLTNPTLTVYWCHLEKIPNFGRMHHLVGYEKLMTEANEPLIHHLHITVCFFDFPMKEGGLYCSLATPYRKHCSKFAAFAPPGTKSYFFPPHTGIPFGSTETTAMYFEIEVHYNLPRKNFVLNDNSGFRLYHTDKLRPFDTSFFKIGIEVLQIIPPRQNEFSNVAVCSPDCLQKSVPPDGFHIMSYVFHSHHRARKMILHHLRNGQEISRISDNFYDFHLQEFRNLEKEIHVLPNDVLVMNCIFDSSNESSTTVYGLDTEHEMCEIYMQTYPPIKLFKCMSVFQIDNLADHFPEISNYRIGSLANTIIPINGRDIELFLINDFFSVMNLSVEEAKIIQNMYFQGIHTIQCQRTNGNVEMQYKFDEFIPLREPVQCLQT